MASAFYSRNNSYSRSYNATQAENEQRFPLTRAAEHLGISLSSFKKGCENCSYTATEWHHVGKYANRVDYYDTLELSNSILFWQGAGTKNNKQLCSRKIKAIVENSLAERLKVTIEKNVSIGATYFYSGFEFSIMMQVENEHNLRKGFKEICRLYLAKPIKLEIKKLEIETIDKFILYENGLITTKKGGRTLRSGEIDFNKYYPSIEYKGGVLFNRIK